MAANPFQRSLRESLETLPVDLVATMNITVDDLITSTPKTYSSYGPLLLLPAHTFAAELWQKFLRGLQDDRRERLYCDLALRMNATHIALNAPIASTVKDADRDETNVQRRPNISPLYGDFGPFATSSPAPSDFESAFWVSTRQNGIVQTWAPLYTMFSRGNVTEKARLLTLPSVKASTADPQGCTAVDLYAGIGYFAFSYAKAGCAKVLGFELNPWSVEGLRRGAKGNKWPCSTIGCDALPEDFDVSLDSVLTVFEMNNEMAGHIVTRNRNKLPPVRHVNLGLLPTSSGAYAVSARCLDPAVGGWLHVHENFATKEIVKKAEMVRGQIQELVHDLKGDGWHVELEHVEKVKTYAPGVMHCVLDICLLPTRAR